MENIMKKLSQAVAFVAVTTLFATAFTTNHFDQRHSTQALVAPDNNITQVVIVGKRMTAQEKAQYDGQIATQASAATDKVNQSGFHIAVK
jgi:hypothetical protein